MNTRRKLIGSGVLILALSALYSADVASRESRSRSVCNSNLRQIGLALSIYMRDYDEKAVIAERWETDLTPYYFDRARPPLRCPSGNGYAFNRYLSGFSFALVDDWAKTPTAFDSTSNGPNFSDFGSSYAGAGAHVLRGRGGGSNVLFLDGHLKWMQRKPIFQAIKLTPPPIFIALKRTESRAFKPSR